MTPLPLGAPSGWGLTSGDIVTIEGCYNRPPTRIAAWWAMLILSPPRAARHLVWPFRRRDSDPFYHLPMTRRGLFEPRRLQTYRITGDVTA